MSSKPGQQSMVTVTRCPACAAAHLAWPERCGPVAAPGPLRGGGAAFGLFESRVHLAVIALTIYVIMNGSVKGVPVDALDLIRDFPSIKEKPTLAGSMTTVG